MKSFGTNEQKIDGQCLSMKKETAGKIGLFGAICVIVGAGVGIGVFFKNSSVFKSNNGNACGILLSWFIVIVIALCTAYSFGEICRCKTKNANSGLAGWAERYAGYNLGRFLKIAYPLFYWAIISHAINTFFGEALLNINPDWACKIPVFWWVLAAGFGFALLIIGLNMFTNNIAKHLPKYLTPIKFIPILIVIIAGFTAGAMSNEHNLFIHPGNYAGSDAASGDFSMVGVLNCLPGIMFAFDSFLMVGNIAKDVKNPNTNVPLSIIISMSITSVVYITVSLAQIVCGCATPYELFTTLLGGDQLKMRIATSIIGAFLFISIFGCMNSAIFVSISNCQSVIDEKIIIGHRWFKKIGNGKCNNFSGGVLYLIIQLFYFCTISITGGVLGTDQIHDGMTNLVCEFYFVIYGFMALMSIINRKTNKIPTTEAPRQKGQCIAATISFLGCTSIALYGIIYQWLIVPIQQPNELIKAWGLFVDNKTQLTNAQAACVFWSIGIMFIAIPFIHDLLLKLFDKENTQKLIWERTKINKISEPEIASK